jgi:hypothetical protein
MQNFKKSAPPKVLGDTFKIGDDRKTVSSLPVYHNGERHNAATTFKVSAVACPEHLSAAVVARVTCRRPRSGTAGVCRSARHTGAGSCPGYGDRHGATSIARICPVAVIGCDGAGKRRARQGHPRWVRLGLAHTTIHSAEERHELYCGSLRAAVGAGRRYHPRRYRDQPAAKCATRRDRQASSDRRSPAQCVPLSAARSGRHPKQTDAPPLWRHWIADRSGTTRHDPRRRGGTPFFGHMRRPLSHTTGRFSDI